MRYDVIKLSPVRMAIAGNYWATLDVESSTQADTGAGSGSRLSARQHSS